MKMPKIIIGLWFVAAFFTAGAAWAEEAQTVEARGEAAILDNDKAMARDKALEDAQRKAVESAVGTLISSETVTENYQLISDRILAQSSGYIRKYKIVSERTEDNVYVVEISAEVMTGQVSSDLEGLKNLMRRKNMPKIIVMIAEQNIGVERPQYWWSVTGIPAIDMRVAEHTIIEQMREKGFTFVDPEVLSGKKKVTMPVAMLSDKQARQISKTTDAQLIIVGKAMASDLGQTAEGARQRSARAEVAVRVINCENGEVIASSSRAANSYHMTAQAAGSAALKVASKKVAEELIDRIAKKWVEETGGSNSIRVTVSGANNKNLNKFIDVLQHQVRGVKAVARQSMKGGTAVLDITMAGDGHSLATEIEAKDFGGGLKVEVEETANNALKVKLLP